MHSIDQSQDMHRAVLEIWVFALELIWRLSGSDRCCSSCQETLVAGMSVVRCVWTGPQYTGYEVMGVHVSSPVDSLDLRLRLGFWASDLEHKYLSCSSSSCSMRHGIVVYCSTRASVS